LVIVSLPFFMLARWIFGDQVALPQVRPQPFSPPPAAPSGGGGPAWLGIARAVFFWLALIALAVYLVRSFFREHPEIRRALASFRPVRWLIRLWKAWRERWALWRAGRARPRRGGAVEGEGLGRGRAILSAPRAPDSNRERVRYYYLDVVRRARRAGYPRKPAQTPLVYGALLGEELPEAREQVDLVTESFVEARYSRHPIETSLVDRVKRGWRQLKTLLGGKREDQD
jgi:hypothetical protein